MKSTLKSSLLLALMAVSTSLSASAQTLYYGDTGSGVVNSPLDTTWNTTDSNWSATSGSGSATTWTNGDAAVFGGTAGTVTLSGTLSASSLTFSNTSGTYLLTGGGLTLTGSGSIVLNNTTSDTIGSVITAAGGLTTSGTGTLVFTAAPVVTGTVAVGGTSTVDYSTSAISAGYNHTTTIASGATMMFDGTTNANLGGSAAFSGAGNLTIGSGTGSFAGGFFGLAEGSNTITGTTTINIAGNAANSGTGWPGGEVFIDNANSLSASSLLNMQNGRIDLRANASVAGISGTNSTTVISGDGSAGTYSVTVTDNVASGSVSYGGWFSNTVTGSGAGAVTTGFIKTGAGTQVLAGSLSYSGVTTVSGGTLQIGNNSGSTTVNGFANTVTVASGATLVFDGSTTNSGVTAAVSGAGNLTIGTGTGSFTTAFLNLNIANTITGTTTVNIDGAGAWPGSEIFINNTNSLSSGSVLQMTNGNIDLRNTETVAGLTGTNTATVIGTDGARNLAFTINTAVSTSYTYAGVIANSVPGGGGVTVGLTKQGTGTQILTGTTSYTGATTITAGTLQFGSQTAGNAAVNSLNSAVSIASGATLVLDGGTANETLGAGVSLTGAGNLQIGTGTASFASSLIGLNNASNNITGTTTINLANGATWANGEVFINSTNSLSSGSLLSMVNGSIDLRSNTAVAGITGSNASTQISSDKGTPTATDTLTDNVATGTVTYAGALFNLAPGSASGGAGLSTVAFTKTGAGTQVLTGNVAYTGATAINTGTLQLGATTDTTSSAINTFASAVTIASGATLVLDGGSANSTLGSGTTLTGAGNLQIGTGTGSFTGAYTGLNEASNNITGTTTINLTNSGTWPAGVVFINSANSLSATSLLSMVNGKLDFRGSSPVAGITGSNSATYIGSDNFANYAPVLTDNVASGTQTYAGHIVDSLPGAPNLATAKFSFTKTGAGTQVLSGSNTYSGSTSVTGGELSITGSSTGASPTSVSGSGSILDVPGSYAGANTTISSGGQVNVDSTGTYTASGSTGSITGSGSALNVVGTYGGSGTTSVSGGGLVNVNGGTYSAPGITSVGGGGTLRVDQGGPTGIGAVTQATINVVGTSATSKALLTGDGTIGFSNPSAVNTASVNVGNFGVLSPGDASDVSGVTSPLIMNSAVGVTMNDGSTLAFVLNGTTAGAATGGYSQLNFNIGSQAGNNVLALNGSVNLQLTLNYVPTPGDTFLLTNDSFGEFGTFSQLNGVATNLSEGATFTLNTTPFEITYIAGTQGGDVELIAEAVPEPSDLALLAAGLVALLGLNLRRSRSKQSRA